MVLLDSHNMSQNRGTVLTRRFGQIMVGVKRIVGICDLTDGRWQCRQWERCNQTAYLPLPMYTSQHVVCRLLGVFEMFIGTSV